MLDQSRDWWIRVSWVEIGSSFSGIAWLTGGAPRRCLMDVAVEWPAGVLVALKIPLGAEEGELPVVARVAACHGDFVEVELLHAHYMSVDDLDQLLRRRGTGRGLGTGGPAPAPRELVEAAHRARLATLGMLTASISHQLAGPLTVLGVGVESMRATHRALDTETCADMAVSLEELFKLRRCLLDFAGRGEPAPHPVTVAEVVDVALTLVKHELRRCCAVELEVDERLRIEGDRVLLTQLLVNLLKNAADAFDPARLDQNRVRVRAHADGDLAVLEVVDNGPGMSEAVLGRIFERFFSTKPPERGSGVGLWFCRWIAGVHGGVVELQSRPGEGTRAEVRVPALGHTRPVRRNPAGWSAGGPTRVGLPDVA